MLYASSSLLAVFVSSLLFLAVVVCLHRYFLSVYFSLPIGISTALFFVALVAIFAVYSTHGKTIMLPVLIGVLLIFYLSRMRSDSIKLVTRYRFFIATYFFHTILISGFVFYKVVTSNGNCITVTSDFSFYINQLLMIQQTGVETILDVSLCHYPSPYHYFDLWFLGFFNLMPIPFNLITFFIVFPFLATLISQSVCHIASRFKHLQYSISDFIISLSAVYIIAFLFPFVTYFTPLELLQSSVMGYPKLLFVALLLVVLLYLYYEKKWTSFFIFSLVASLGFLTLLPAVLFFAGLVFLYLLVTRNYPLKKDFLLLVVYGLFSLLFVYFLYLDYNTIPNAIHSTSSSVLDWKGLLVYFVLALLYCGYFLPYYLLPIVNQFSLKNLKQLLFYPSRFFYSPFLLVLGGILGTLLFYKKFVDYYQFYFVTLLPFCALWLSVYLLLRLQRFTLVGIGYSGVLVLVVIWTNLTLFQAVGQKKQEDVRVLTTFMKDKPFPTSMAFLVSSKWKSDPYYVNPDFFAPEELFFINKQPMASYWIGLYPNDLPLNHKYYANSKRSLLSTSFQHYHRQHSNLTLVQSQLAFIQLKKVRCLVVDHTYVSPFVVRTFSDSIVLPLSGIKIYTK